MSQENVDAFKRGVNAINRGDIEGLLEALDPEVVWHDVFHVMLGGQATVYYGHEGVHELFRDLYDAFAETQSTYTEIRDLGDRTIAIGQLRTRGKESKDARAVGDDRVLVHRHLQAEGRLCGWRWKATSTTAAGFATDDS